ncbi:MAG: hypothetical protein ACUVS2_03800 [Candidatus Flexifilum sp.]|jgi:hypothetical protein
MNTWAEFGQDDLALHQKLHRELRIDRCQRWWDGRGFWLRTDAFLN